MARAFWKGAINFGLVMIPVKMYVATTSERPSFHLLHKKDLQRVQQKLYCPGDDEYISREDTVRGYEYAKGQYVVLKDADFEKVPVKTSRTIDVVGFTEFEKIDPVYYYDAHYLEPEVIGGRPYSLFRQALQDTRRVGIAKVSFQRREHLCCIRPSGKILVLHTLHYAHEVSAPDGIMVPEVEVKEEELKMAVTLINEMAIEFRPGEYQDEYKNALNELIRAKLEGEKIPALPSPEVEEVPELLDALRQSIEARKKERQTEKAGAGSRSR